VKPGFGFDKSITPIEVFTSLKTLGFLLGHGQTSIAISIYHFTLRPKKTSTPNQGWKKPRFFKESF